MKYLIAASLFLNLLAFPMLQAQSEAYKQLLLEFQQQFNNKDAEAVFGLMDNHMQSQLGIENVTSIVHTFRLNLGALQNLTYLKTEGITEVYEAQFEQGKQHIAFSVNKDGKFNGLRFLPAPEEQTVAKMERSKTSLALPFKGQWFTFWGGDTKAQNYHVVSKTQKHAFDFLILGKGNKTYERSGTRNEDYYAFGKPIYAVCDAEVFQVITGVADNKPGAMNPAQALGNSVTLKTANNEYIVYAHFEYGTVQVKEGDRVKKGQMLGRCGNSGNSSEPHLHLHIQDGPNPLTSIGVKCYFEKVQRRDTILTDYSPVRLDVISKPLE